VPIAAAAAAAELFTLDRLQMHASKATKHAHHIQGGPKINHYQSSSLNHTKTVNEAIFFINFEFKMSKRIL